MDRQICYLTVLLLVSADVASAQVTLERKFTEGSKANLLTEERSNYTLMIAGTKLEYVSTTFSNVSSSIGGRDHNGGLTIREKAETLQSETSMPDGQTLRFDSVNPDEKANSPELEPILASFRARCLPVTIKLDSKNKIVGANLPDGEFEKLPATAIEQFKAESLKNTAEGMVAYLPDGAVKKGDTWERTVEMQLSEAHVMTSRIKFEYAGSIEQDGKTLEKITSTVLDVSYVVKNHPMYELTAEGIKVAESESVYLFDRGLGALVSRNTRLHVSGQITIVFPDGTKLPGTFDMTLDEKAVRQK